MIMGKLAQTVDRLKSQEVSHPPENSGVPNCEEDPACSISFGDLAWLVKSCEDLRPLFTWTFFFYAFVVRVIALSLMIAYVVRFSQHILMTWKVLLFLFQFGFFAVDYEIYSMLYHRSQLPTWWHRMTCGK
jgi:hypothetical protein